LTTSNNGYNKHHQRIDISSLYTTKNASSYLLQVNLIKKYQTTLKQVNWMRWYHNTSRSYIRQSNRTNHLFGSVAQRMLVQYCISFQKTKKFWKSCATDSRNQRQQHTKSIHCLTSIKKTIVYVIFYWIKIRRAPSRHDNIDFRPIITRTWAILPNTEGTGPIYQQGSNPTDYQLCFIPSRNCEKKRNIKYTINS
jgi:hypothetical protein